MERVLSRRSTLLRNKQEELQKLETKWNEKLENSHRISLLHTNNHANIQRQKQWLQYLYFLKTLKFFHQIVDNLREIKQTDRKRFFAFRVIERFVNQYLRTNLQLKIQQRKKKLRRQQRHRKLRIHYLQQSTGISLEEAEAMILLEEQQQHDNNNNNNHHHHHHEVDDDNDDNEEDDSSTASKSTTASTSSTATGHRSLVQRMRLAMAKNGKDEDPLSNYHHRLEACSVIVSFLRVCSKQWKVMMIRVIR
jgi:Mg-chelatase subunit ChlI